MAVKNENIIPTIVRNRSDSRNTKIQFGILRFSIS